ncbi:hypothetical protein TIFTF001_027147 [Ficus carica]|uniref:Uncharacterized protein n=1 Tax=Ficus carica TaxID=3494 RepID=A0AA88DME5_FICCA|nr:hypothetical protein TIFTF001_027147 [Ficus carica]
MLQVRRHRWPNRQMPRGGYRQWDRRSDKRRTRCQAADCRSRARTLLSDCTKDVAWTIVGPAKQALLTTRLRCLVWIRGMGLGFSMSGVLDEWHQRGDQVTSHSCTRERLQTSCDLSWSGATE